MAQPYPWIRDSTYVTSGSTPDRLAITSTSGLYFSTSANSSILAPSGADLTIESQGAGGDIVLKTNSNNRLTISDTGIITVNNNYIQGLSGLYGTTTSGVDLNISSNNNILMSADNIDLGTTEIIYPTLGAAARVRIKATGSIVVDNNGGGVVTPAIVLNQVSATGTVLAQEVYNQRTATNTSNMYECFFFGNVTTGAPKLQYASIQVNSPQFNSASAARGSMTFTLRDGVAGASQYLQLDGVNSRLNIPKTLNVQSNMFLNNYNIYNCSSIQTPSGNQYATQSIQYIDNSTPVNMPGFTDQNLRLCYINRNSGGSTALAPYTLFGSQYNASVITSAENFNGYTFFGTSDGRIYYFNTDGVLNIFNEIFAGAIKTMKADNPNGVLYFGGEFSYEFNSGQQYAYIGRIDSGFSISPIFWTAGGNSSNGLNNPVKGLELANNYLYIVGDFTQDSQGNETYKFFACYDINGNTLYPVDGNGSYGFDNPTTFIKYDPTSGYLNIGVRSFSTSFNSNSFSTTVNNILSLLMNQFNVSNGDTSIDSSIGSSGQALCIDIYGSEVLVGGNFSSPYQYIASWSWNFTNYGGGNPPPFGYTPSQPINIIYYSATGSLYYAEYSGNYDLIKNGSNIGSNPNFASWSVLFYAPSLAGVGDAFADQFLQTLPFYYLSSPTVVATIDLTGYTVIYDGNSYTTQILLSTYGSTIELITDNTYYYVLSRQGTVSIS